ncbi:MAG: sporulation protein YqfD [Alkaliphilus sp.]|nr:sporulation protein YqfD [bacterium AH-315-G05]MBN4074725.1 sporulation protein YqfD [bacterium AH-315-E09]PHS36415.1 MAG: sporulation protein YqfD [Alkaliphilus sp.]
MRFRKNYRGFATVRLEGLGLEKIINFCVSKNIDIWDVDRKQYTLLEFKINLRDYKLLNKFSKNHGFRIYVIKETGCEVWTNRILKRKVLAAGAFFSLIILLYLSGFVFRIDVVGNDIIYADDILTELENVGFVIGTRHQSVDLRAIENHLMIHISELAWIGIEIKGVYAKIKIVEKVPSPSKIDKNVPVNVVALKNGVIESVIARSGDAVVKKGDIVAAGDLLISGVLIRENMEHPMFTHAFGEVYARTYYELVEIHPLYEIVQKKTGSKQRETVIIIGTKEYKIGEEVKFNKYNAEKNSYEIINWRNREIFVEVIHIEYYEVIEVSRRVELRDIEETLSKVLLEVLQGSVLNYSEILDTKIEFELIENYMKAELWAEVIENIGTKKRIELEEE